jgi:hypothetical protein
VNRDCQRQESSGKDLLIARLESIPVSWNHKREVDMKTTCHVTTWLGIALLAMLLGMSSSEAILAQDNDPAGQEEGAKAKKKQKKGGVEKIEASALPEEISQAVKKVLPKATIGEASKKTSRRGDEYTLFLTDGKKPYTAQFTAIKDGGFKGMICEKIDVEKLPQKVARGIAKAVPDAKIEGAEKAITTPDNKVMYRVTVSDGTRKVLLLVDEKGKAKPVGGAGKGGKKGKKEEAQ